MALAPAFPVGMLAARRMLANGRPIIGLFWSAVLFSIYFWASALFIVWRT